MLPLSDAPNPGRTPWVTYALIALNVAVYVLITLPLSGQAPGPGDPRVQAYLGALRESLPADVSLREIAQSISLYDLFVFEHGFKPGLPDVSDLMAAMFLHGGFMHLAGNMLFLWIYGDNVEHRLGHVKYLFWYLATGVAATAFFALLAPGSLVPMVGASGAISGVLGFYFWWFPRNVVRVLLLLFPILVRVVEIPARIVLGIYLFMDNIVPMLLAGGDGGGGVAHGAHIGGFIAGLIVAWVYSRRDETATPAEYRAASRAQAPSGVWTAMQAGDMASAARAYFALTPQESRAALEPTQALALGRWLLESGHGQAAHTVFQRYLHDHHEGPGAAEAHLGAGLALLRHLDQPTLAYQHLREVVRLDPAGEPAARARQALASIASQQKLPARRFS